MKVKPILMRADMITSTLEGRKFQTRRVLNIPWLEGSNPDFTQLKAIQEANGIWRIYGSEPASEQFKTPISAGDALWVHETHALVGSIDPGWLIYRANGYKQECDRHGFDKPYPPEPKWTPSIYMPKRMSRATLYVIDVRVQRIQDISEKDAIAEGCRPFFDKENTEQVPCPNGQTIEMEPLKGPLDAFKNLWNDINEKRGFGWQANPWVAAYTYTTFEMNVERWLTVYG